MEKPDPIMTTDQVAEYLGLNPLTVRRLAREGQIPAFKIGRQWRFAREALEHLRGQIIRSTYHRDIRLSDVDGEAIT